MVSLLICPNFDLRCSVFPLKFAFLSRSLSLSLSFSWYVISFFCSQSIYLPLPVHSLLLFCTLNLLCSSLSYKKKQLHVHMSLVILYCWVFFLSVSLSLSLSLKMAQQFLSYSCSYSFNQPRFTKQPPMATLKFIGLLQGCPWPYGHMGPMAITLAPQKALAFWPH